MRRIENVAEALSLLERAVEMRGRDYIYRKPAGAQFCKYLSADKSEPGCIIALALTLHDWTLDDLAPFDSRKIKDGTVLGIAGRYPDMFGPNVALVLRTAQYHQDNEASWGVALGAAEERVKTLSTT